MPRIIFKCPYLKGGNNTAHLSNLVKYIATRSGVQKFSAENKNLPSTKKQTELIRNILKELPDSQNLFEYEDYIQNKTIENASDFISIALEHNLDIVAKKENYVDYIANRPRVEKLSSHGLFTSGDDEIILSKVADEVSNHQGNVWTPIISLRREDAVSTGFDHAENWKNFLSLYAPTIAENLKIPIEDFRWYAAFHNESHHPHIHMICYSTDIRRGYLTKEGIKNIKSGLLLYIFKNEMRSIYEKQSQRRDNLKAESEKSLLQLIAEMETGTIQNSKMEELILLLTEKLKHTTGKRVYGYLQPNVKSIVDSIVDELAKDENVAKAYNLWYEMRNEILLSYSDNLPEPLQLSKQKEFKSIKNFIITEVDKLSKDEMGFSEPQIGEMIDDERSTDSIYSQVIEENSFEEEILPLMEVSDFMEESIDDAVEEQSFPYVKWTEEYKQARKFLFGTEEQEPDFEQACILLQEESEKGNALATFDLGRIYANGLGVEIDDEKAQEYYENALNDFQFVENKKPWKYTQYRIGKMYAIGLGTEQNYEVAADWFTKSANQKYKFAEYSLGGQYLRGQGVEQNNEKSFELYLRSAKQGFPYADFEVAKMYRDAIGTDKNEGESNVHFKKAFIGFTALEKQSHDDKILYRLGWMLQNGIGTEKDISKAKEYFQKSAKLGNTFACYSLAKIILGEESPTAKDVETAVGYLKTASDSGNQFAQYALAKINFEGKHITQDIAKAVELFTLSAEQDNEWAAYRLGKIYITEVNCKNISSAVHWLTKSSEHGNQFAQYQLGKMFLMGKVVPRDKETAIKWFMLSAEQGNEYAQFFLDHIEQWREPSVGLLATRVLHHMSKVFEDNMPVEKSSRGITIDSKLLRKMKEKKMAQGHKEDDQEQNMSL
ncbi:putative beta-lactamase HcpC precursor [Anaerotignum neopropionicum]|uniref:Putative beta-lactamase HcpC n=1 Tax=Anaerotignum neopropionicum TaxID=36847 RepID=A0A136WHE7_9FIRM|nr:MobP3 family relaxase [Anaerotignum neopropionicum]KXL53840.1 putative beta-lactamase HcpC precursor [Anaerotignum neopropionicum]